MRGRRGFTLVEALVAITVMTLIVVKICMLLRMRGDAQETEMTTIAVEDQARRVLEQVAFALMGADRDRLTPDPEAPIHSSEVRFEVGIGVQDGEVVWGDPQWIGLAGTGTQVTWRERPEDPDGRRVVWSNIARPFLEGEVTNGVDDNGNGLVDEKGLTFSLERDLVTIRLTLERRDASGRIVDHTVETVVTCRNKGAGR